MADIIRDYLEKTKAQSFACNATTEDFCLDLRDFMAKVAKESSVEKHKTTAWRIHGVCNGLGSMAGLQVDFDDPKLYDEDIRPGMEACRVMIIEMLESLLA